MKNTKLFMLFLTGSLLLAQACKKTSNDALNVSEEKKTVELRQGYYLGSLISYERINGKNIFNGDMVIPDEQITTRLPEVTTEGHGPAGAYKWPNHKVSYRFAAGFTTSQTNTILTAMADWTAKSGIIFEAVTSGYYLTIQPGSVNNCTVGYVSGATMNLSNPEAKGIVVHELGHAIGLHHEQLRADRDAYIAVKWDNISASAQSGYNKLTGMNYGGTTFDISSIMLYGSYNGYGAINSSLPTTTRLDGSTWIDNSWSGTKSPSTKDASWVKTIYGI
ncbi:Astacin (Peptidase family M12A) [Pedobacter terrae]|uniref:Astacin (Peptidase family M12A) n=1 Tax=Pedobacter terrae TaxID=405671 RepID=A0A1G7MY51_9SPHI|nr:M12 family metallopeptidase [Pedobacter terrae]SDF66642.1 Astacin (Peptidase family M12A) [Pedobacter terrae]